MIENENLNPEELQVPQLTTIPAEPIEVVDEVETEGLEEITDEEEQELSDEEKKLFYIEQLKASKIKFHPQKHPTKTIKTGEVRTVFGHKRNEMSKIILTNETVNQFDKNYRKKRQNKNKQQKLSRKNS